MTELADRLRQTTGWDAQMRELMLAGRHLPAPSDALCQAENEVPGCESQVWLSCALDEGGVLSIQAWSNSKIVRGLLVVLLDYVQSHAVTQIPSLDLANYLSTLGLGRHLSQSRSNGLNAVMSAIKTRASGLS
ncbi:SufE family protein [Bowmanella pacifica]|uniref:SufE protein n=1 Tax=Bowmanella pacifica TaxID=502051 RepID=A0A918DMN3_9ALTE|nr:SufE family protein [Bowmanella pacifica]GGO72524.1 SufE protein [Bowmanella pacifica]